MTDAEFVSRRLLPDDDLAAFDSGQSDVDGWLRRSAQHADSIRSGRTWVWAEGNSVRAYFTLTGHLLERETLPRKVGRGSPDRIPCVLIARLALDAGLQGRGLGSVLLADASSRILTATEIVAARLVVVDAIDERANDFYVHHGYVSIPGTRRLVRKLSEIADDLGW